MDIKEQRLEIIIVGDEIGAKATIKCNAGNEIILQTLPTAIANILIKTSKDPIRFTNKMLEEYIDQLEENGSEKECYEKAKNHARADA